MSITSKIFCLLVGALFVYVIIANCIELVDKEYETEVSVLTGGTDSVSFDGVYIRDEAPLFASYSGVLRYYAADGEKVLPGNVVAEVYGSEDDIENIDKINSLTSEVSLLRKIENPDMTVVANPSGISEQIAKLCDAHLNSVSKGEYESVESARENLLFLMCTYDKITGKLSGVTDRANELEEELAAMRQTVSRPASTIAADKPGYFVSAVDGYEGQLSSSIISTITKEQIFGLTRGNSRGAGGQDTGGQDTGGQDTGGQSAGGQDTGGGQSAGGQDTGGQSAEGQASGNGQSASGNVQGAGGSGQGAGTGSSGVIFTKSETAGAIGKIVANSNCYIICIFDYSLGKYTAKTNVKLKTSQSGVTIDAVISEIRKTDNPKQDIVILQSEYIYPTAMRLRTEKIEMIKNEYEGVKVPRSAIHFKYLDEISLDENNEPIQTGFDKNGKEVYKTEPVEYRGVYVKQGDAVIFKKICSIYEGDDYVVSKIPTKMLAEVPEGSGGDLDFNIREIKTKEVNGWGVDQLQKTYVSLYDEMIIKGF